MLFIGRVQVSLKYSSPSWVVICKMPLKITFYSTYQRQHCYLCFIKLVAFKSIRQLMVVCAKSSISMLSSVYVWAASKVITIRHRAQEHLSLCNLLEVSCSGIAKVGLGVHMLIQLCIPYLPKCIVCFVTGINQHTLIKQSNTLLKQSAYKVCLLN